MLLPAITHLIATNLLFNRPVIVLGPTGSGKYFVTQQALSFLNDNRQGSLNHIQIDCRAIKRYDSYHEYEWYPQIACGSRHMTKCNNVINNNPDRIIFYSSIEDASPPWIQHMFANAMYKHKVIMVGDWCEDDLLMDRCEVVRM